MCVLTIVYVPYVVCAAKVYWAPTRQCRHARCVPGPSIAVNNQYQGVKVSSQPLMKADCILVPPPPEIQRAPPPPIPLTRVEVGQNGRGQITECFHTGRKGQKIRYYKHQRCPTIITLVVMTLMTFAENQLS